MNVPANYAMRRRLMAASYDTTLGDLGLGSVVYLYEGSTALGNTVGYYPYQIVDTNYQPSLNGEGSVILMRVFDSDTAVSFQKSFSWSSNSPTSSTVQKGDVLKYDGGTADTLLTSTVYNSYDTNTRRYMRNVTIPAYSDTITVANSATYTISDYTLSRKIFLPSFWELGFTHSTLEESLGSVHQYSFPASSLAPILPYGAADYGFYSWEARWLWTRCPNPMANNDNYYPGAFAIMYFGDNFTGDYIPTRSYDNSNTLYIRPCVAFSKNTPIDTELSTARHRSGVVAYKPTRTVTLRTPTYPTDTLDKRISSVVEVTLGGESLAVGNAVTRNVKDGTILRISGKYYNRCDFIMYWGIAEMGRTWTGSYSLEFPVHANVTLDFTYGRGESGGTATSTLTYPAASPALSR